MVNSNSIIEFYRKSIVSGIVTDCVYNSTNDVGEKVKVQVWPTWKTKTHELLNFNDSTTTQTKAERVFLLGEHLREILYSSNANTSRDQDEVSSGGYLWERLVTYYLNLCLCNSRTVVFIGPSNIDSLHKAMSFNGMDSASEVDLLAVTFPDNELFTGDKSIAIETLKQQHPNDDNLPEELACIYSRRIRKEETRIERLTNYLATYYFKDFEAHVLQCKTNWNDSIQAPMLWSLIYYLSRDGITLPTGSNIKFGSGLYTLPRLKNFSYSFVTVPTQNNGDYEEDPEKAAKKREEFYKSFSEDRLPVKRGKLIRGGYYWGLPKYNTINPIHELLNTNLQSGFEEGHCVEHIQRLIENNTYTTDAAYFDFF